MRIYRIIAAALVLMLALSGVALAQDSVTIRLAGWASSPEEDAALTAMLDAFMAANPDIEVEFQPSTTYNETMQTAFAAGDYAEVFYVNSDTVASWVDAGVIADGSSEIADQDDIYESLRNVFTLDGTLYCAPKDFSTLALQYNKDMFDAAGLGYPTADWTWDDLKAAAETLTGDNADGQRVLGLVLPADLNRWLPLIYQGGGMLFDAEGNYALNSQESIDSMNFFLDIVAAGNAGPASAVDSGWGGEALGNGRAAMVMEGNWVVQYTLNTFPDLNWGIAEMPAGPAGKATMAYTVCYGVRGIDNPHPEESWALANFLTGKEGAEMVATSGFGVMPGRASAAEAWMETWTTKLADLGKEDLADQVNAFVSGADYAQPWRLPAGWNVFNDTFNASLQEAYAGNKFPEDVIADASQVAEELMAE
jgi:multiple sugar transport system substrate-binding protein